MTVAHPSRSNRAGSARLAAAVLAGSAAIPLLAVAAPPGPTPTVAQYIAKVSHDAPQAVADYCSSAIPSLKASIAPATDRFVDKLEFAATAAANNLGMKLADPVPPELEDALGDVNGAMLASAKQAKPEDYCAALVHTFNSTTAESLRVSIETGYADNEARRSRPSAAAPAPRP